MAEDRDYKVGYGKPPEHTRFKPGESGFKGQRKRKETNAEIIRRVRDELVTINGKTMTKFELSIHSTINQTIKSRRPRDLKVLFELLDKYGAVPKAVEAAEAEAAGNAVIQKLFDYADKVLDIDPADAKALDTLNANESDLVMKCGNCGPELRRRWKDPDYVALAKRYGRSAIHALVLEVADARKKRRREA